ncbi:glycosyltransferase [Mycobacterium sp. pV006]|uniref:glycosyltransferase n=1 Tax=Mycobacterium sp. pV006 TaxID=3238983 RepID=UPI00351BA302
MVTLISPDGAYGGPLRVALNQAQILRSFGHEVVVAAGASGYRELPVEIGDVPVVPFPASRIPGFGYAGTCAPRMRRWIIDNGVDFDIAHVHFARDLVTIPAARTLRRLGMPMVLQPHGMVTPMSHPLAGVVDRVWTTDLLANADCVLALTEREVRDLRAVGGSGLKVRQLPNGVPLDYERGNSRDEMGQFPEVLFFARLHERKRADVFAEAALELLISGVKAKFSVVGPPEGGERAVDAVIERARALGYGPDLLVREPATPPERALERMSQASIYVLPAVREPFAMTILEALTLELPVVMCADGGLAPFVSRHRCGTVVDGSVSSLAAAITDLLNDPKAAREMGGRGRSAVADELSIAAVGRRLESIYNDVLEGRREPAA